ncbi:hypothetical protein BIY26_21415 [Brenneria goodwinii]|uniref:Uncharacterized protein n=2 Tax=Brenneria TaxID=71655 RepID=A0AAE8EKJ9_9GAMM|nr:MULTISPECIES: hypothetical protein [Brenneria]ATA26800.1 hypothetical protein AWC36_23340 [Brenneria goodwinii]MCL2892486.1 hypothetical protein [Brenneria tiliae]RLM17125.1 hypothetical protein BIY26_21415 [Brenneria goodwinii]
MQSNTEAILVLAKAYCGAEYKLAELRNAGGLENDYTMTVTKRAKCIIDKTAPIIEDKGYDIKMYVIQSLDPQKKHPILSDNPIYQRGEGYFSFFGGGIVFKDKNDSSKIIEIKKDIARFQADEFQAEDSFAILSGKIEETIKSLK